MNLNTITMPRVEARLAYLELRASIREAHQKELDAVHQRQLEMDKAAARAYRQLSIGNQLIRLTPTILGGFDDRYRPRMAIVRADQVEVRVNRWRSGQISFTPSNDRWTRDRTKRIEIAGPSDDRIEQTVEALATVPSIPPIHRPEHRLSNYHLLWEAAWRAVNRPRPRAPQDPALLKHLGGDLWAVLAIWDLTDVERAVLEGSRV